MKQNFDIDSEDFSYKSSSSENKPKKTKKKRKKNISETLGQIVQELKKIWSTFSVNPAISAQYLEAFAELPAVKSFELAKSEVKQAIKQESFLLTCMKNIKIREESLKGLKVMNQYLLENPNWKKSQMIITECAEVLHAHRIITLSVAESIMNWACNFKAFVGKYPIFIENNENYLDKLLYDTDFLGESEMSKVFFFLGKKDPFLIHSANFSNVSLDKVQNNYFFKGNQVSIPVQFEVMNKIVEVQKFLNTGEVTTKILAQVTQKVKENKKSLKNVVNKNSDESVVYYISMDVLDEFIAFVLRGVCEDAAVDAIGRGIVFRILDMNKILKELAREIISDLATVKLQQKESENSIGKLSYISRSFKVTKSNNFSKKSPNSPIIPYDADSPILIQQKRTTNSNQNEEISKSFDRKNKSPSINTRKSTERSFLSKDLDKSWNSPKKLPKPSNLFSNIDNFSKANIVKSPIPYLSKTPNRQNMILTEERKLLNKEFQEKEKPIKKLTKLEPLLTDKPLKDSQLTLYYNEVSISPALSEKKRSKVGMNDLIIMEKVYREYIETLINELKLRKVVEDCILEFASQGDKKLSLMNQQIEAISTWKLQEKIYSSLIDSFLNKAWLKDLATQVVEYSSTPRRSRINSIEFLESINNAVIEEPEDFISKIFTPKIHSPNNVLSRIDSVSENTEKSSVFDEKFEFSIEKKVNQQNFRLICSPIKNIEQEYYSYFGNLTETYKKSCLEFKEVMKIMRLAVDYTWMEYVKGGNLAGWIGFCTEFNENLRVARVLHAATINPNDIQVFINESINLFDSLDFSIAIFEFSHTLNAYERAFKQLKKNKTIEKNKVSIIIQEKTRNTYGNTVSAIVTTSELQKVNIPFAEPNPAMIEYGSRSHLALHLYKVLKENNSLSEFPNTENNLRLQQELSDLLEILCADSNFNFEPLVYAGFPEWKKSQIELKFNFMSFSHTLTTVNNTKYLFLRFHQVLISKNDHYSIYFTKTTDPSITVAFITYPNIIKELESGMRSQKTDVFWKAENLLHSAEEKKSFNGDFCVPGFSKNVSWDVGWVKGFQTNFENEKFINSCEEKFSWNTIFPYNVVNSSCGNAKIEIKDEFIVAVMQKQIGSILDSPLFVALVRENNWIRID